MIPTTAMLIAKEDVPSLVFPNEPVRLSPVHREDRERKVRKAMRLGNNEHHKCRILFRDNVGLKLVETTVWSFDEKNVVLKYGHRIPLERVIDITFF